MEMHESLADWTLPLMLYSFHRVNAHVKAKIEPIWSHVISNLSSIIPAFSTL